MIMTTYLFHGKGAFRDVYINALVRDEEGRDVEVEGQRARPHRRDRRRDARRSRSETYANMLDPRRGVDREADPKKQFRNGIPSFGADALPVHVRKPCHLCRTLNFDLSRCDGYRNFCNKLWNATRFVLMNVQGRHCVSIRTSPGVCLRDRWALGPIAAGQGMPLPRTSPSIVSTCGARSTIPVGRILRLVRRCAKVQLQQAAAADDAAAARGTRSVRCASSKPRCVSRTRHAVHHGRAWQTVAPLAQVGRYDSLQPFPKATSKTSTDRGRDMVHCAT